MNLLLLKGYNNYFNRIVKKHSTLSEYQSNSKAYLTLTNINFNTNDGVVTDLIVGKGDIFNWETVAEPVTGTVYGTPDYLVCYETTVDNTDPNNPVTTNTILQRWFVLESEKQRGGQFKLALKRDVLADNLENVMSAPCFVEKGFIDDTSNALLRNPEGSVVNEIKQSEQLIKDETQCAWLVGYLKKELAQVDVQGIMNKDLDNYIAADSLPIKDCIQYYDKNGAALNSNPKRCIYNPSPVIRPVIEFLSDPTLALNWAITRIVSPSYVAASTTNVYDPHYDGITSEAFKVSTGNSASAASNHIAGKTTTFINTSTGSSLYTALCDAYYSKASSSDNTQFFKGSDFNNIQTGLLVSKNIGGSNKVFELTMTAVGSASVQYNPTFETTGDLNVAAKSFCSALANSDTYIELYTTHPERPRLYMASSGTVYTFIARETVAPGTITFTLPAYTSRNCLNDELYDMFCLPYCPNQNIYLYDGSNSILLDNDISTFIANATMVDCQVQDAAANAYDLQLLPYCPLNIQMDTYNNNPRLRIDKLNAKSYAWVTDSNSAKKSVMLFPTSANFTKNIALAANLNTINNDMTDQTYYNQEMTYNDDGGCHIAYVDITGLPAGWTLNDSLAPNIFINGNLATQDTDLYIDPSLNKISIITWYFTNQYIEEDVTAYSITVVFKYNYISPVDALDLKVSNECDFCRLAAPNFNSIYQFKLSKLENADMSYVNIDCTYKPFNPYIKLNPNFSGLYGQDFNDSTGLILSGDYSLSILTDPWKQYQLNNKNYEAMFGRQIQNLDVNQQLAREQQQFTGVVNAITGGVGGAAGGALTGAKLGGGWGALAGGIAGGATGTIAGVAGYFKDKEWLERAQAETKSYSRDMYNFQLGNIQALPQSITKSSPFGYNFKIWPVLEKFSCSPEERETVKNKIIYDGMTINAIGTLYDYSQAQKLDKVYLKGQLIRLEDIVDDFHIADAIYQEVFKGFYIGE